MPLAPNCTFFWTSLLTVQEVESLRKWLAASDVKVEDGICMKIMGTASDDVVKFTSKDLCPSQNRRRQSRAGWVRMRLL